MDFALWILNFLLLHLPRAGLSVGSQTGAHTCPDCLAIPALSLCPVFSTGYTCELVRSCSLLCLLVSVFWYFWFVAVRRDHMKPCISSCPIRAHNRCTQSGPLPLELSCHSKQVPRAFLKGTQPQSCIFFSFLAFAHSLFAVTQSSHTCHFGASSFDCTCGYPGEGPSSDFMTLYSANVGSIATNHDWKTWQSQVVCLQETRIGKNNHRSAHFAFREAGFAEVLGKLLPGFIKATGRAQTPCGGVAILGPPTRIQPFQEQDDQTGLYLQSWTCVVAGFPASQSVDLHRLCHHRGFTGPVHP